MGFDYLDRAYKLIYAMDNWNVACESYKANFHRAEVACVNALSLKPADIPKADIYIGGPPCQDFSACKDLRRKTDVSLINWFFSVIEYHKPKYWIMENVPQVRGYIPRQYHWKIYAMLDYGIPQIRKRCFTGVYEEPRMEPAIVRFPAVTASEYVGSPGNRPGNRLAASFNRKALVPEAKLVQTFPLDFIVLGTLKDQYIQIGNAVPPMFSYKLAEAIMIKEGF